MSHETLDHTSVIKLIELVTGVRNRNISAWRRQHTGDFTGVLGAVPSKRIPRLPDTIKDLERAERQFQNFKLPPIPGNKQQFPHQPQGHKPIRRRSAVTAPRGVSAI